MRCILSLILSMALMLPSFANTNRNVASYRLENGLQVFVQEDHRAPVVVSQVWYKVGASYEPTGITGISHALEHMMFKGTPAHGPGVFSRIIAENGGEENAMTDRDYTVYYQQLDASKLPISFELEADRMKHLILDPSEFKKEIQVVMEERRMRYEDNPQSLAYERLMAAANIATGYHHMTIGWMNDLQNMTDEDLRAWYKQWYAPNNAFIVVVGDVKPQEVFDSAKKYFGDIKSSALPIIKPQLEVPPLGTRQLEVELPAQLPWLVMAYNVPSVKTDTANNDPYVLSVISAILDAGKGSRFAKEIIRKKQTAVDLNVDYDLYARLESLFLIEGTPAPSHTIAELRSEIEKEIKQLQTTLVTQDELARVKALVIAAKVYSQDSIANQASEIGSLEAVGLSWKLRDEYVTRIGAVTPQQIQSVAQKYFIPNRLTQMELKPLPLNGKAVKNASPVAVKQLH